MSDILHVMLNRSGGASFGFDIVNYADDDAPELALYIGSVLPGGIAASTGMIHVGDQVMKINGTAVDTFFDHDAAIAALCAKERLVFELKPDDELPEYATVIANAVANQGKKKQTAIALYDYDTAEDDELSFRAGDIVEMLEEEFDEVGWTPCTHIQGANRGKTGLVCYNFIAFLEDLVVERLGTYVSFGIGFGTCDGGEAIVTGVTAGSPSDGILEANDQIVVLNGKLMCDLTHEAATAEIARSLKLLVSVRRTPSSFLSKLSQKRSENNPPPPPPAPPSNSAPPPPPPVGAPGCQALYVNSVHSGAALSACAYV